MDDIPEDCVSFLNMMIYDDGTLYDQVNEMIFEMKYYYHFENYFVASNYDSLRVFYYFQFVLIIFTTKNFPLGTILLSDIRKLYLMNLNYSVRSLNIYK